MSTRTPLLLREPQRRLRSSPGYICPQCRLAQRRNVSTSWLQKKAAAKAQWAQWATEIRAGKRSSMLTTLEDRGFVHDLTGDRKLLDRLMTDKRMGVYCGVDPTAPSLHVGHMLPLMALFWMYVHGFHAVSLIGGSTAKIGDPTGRTKDRAPMTSTERKANMVSMHYQVKKIWDNCEKVAAKHGYAWEPYWHREIVNNAAWWGKTTFVDVLKYMGNGVRLGPMLGRDTVKNKMASGDGMAFSEFCYPIMQAWDWWHMFKSKDVQLQIGGSDQYGNIIAGLDAVRHVARTHPDPDVRLPESGNQEALLPYGFTVPLLTSASGEKFGKSAGNAVWLDENMTSLFDLYGFFVRTADEDVERYLKLFTFTSREKIQSIMDKHRNDPSKRMAQHTLAREFVELVHGAEKAERAETSYRQKAESRNSTSFASLVSLGSRDQMDSMSSEDIGIPAKSPKTPISESTESNRLTESQSAKVRESATYASQKLNHFAPHGEPNKDLPGMHVVLPKSLIYKKSIAQVLYSAGLVSSRSEGHRLAQNQGAYIGRRSSDAEQMGDDVTFTPAKLHDPDLTWRNVIQDNETVSASGRTMDKEGEEGMLVLRSGKWKIRVVRIVSDDKFQALNLPPPPGWQEHLSSLVSEKALASQVGTGKPLESDEFVEPTHQVHRRDKTFERTRGRQKGMAFFENEAVRRESPTTRAYDGRSGNPRLPDEESAHAAVPPTTPSHSPAPSKPANTHVFPWETEKEQSTRSINDTTLDSDDYALSPTEPFTIHRHLSGSADEPSTRTRRTLSEQTGTTAPRPRTPFPRHMSGARPPRALRSSHTPARRAELIRVAHERAATARADAQAQLKAATAQRLADRRAEERARLRDLEKTAAAAGPREAPSEEARLAETKARRAEEIRQALARVTARRTRQRERLVADMVDKGWWTAGSPGGRGIGRGGVAAAATTTAK